MLPTLLEHQIGSGSGSGFPSKPCDVSLSEKCTTTNHYCMNAESKSPKFMINNLAHCGIATCFECLNMSEADVKFTRENNYYYCVYLLCKIGVKSGNVCFVTVYFDAADDVSKGV